MAMVPRAVYLLLGLLTAVSCCCAAPAKPPAVAPVQERLAAVVGEAAEAVEKLEGKLLQAGDKCRLVTAERYRCLTLIYMAP